MLLGLISRALAVNVPSVMSRVSTESIALSALVPFIHISSFRILQSFILSCGMNLITHASFVSKLFIQTLRWTVTTSWPHKQEKPFVLLRGTVYECLKVWLIRLRLCCGIEKHASDLVTSLLKDIHSEMPSVTLAVPPQCSKGKVGKKRRQALRMNTAMDAEDVGIHSCANMKLCYSSLDVIPPLLEATSSLLPPKLHQDLQEAIIKKILDIHSSVVNGGNMPVPYSDDDCRVKLYEVLLSLCINHQPKFAPPIPFAISLFSLGIKDLSIKVSCFCSTALSIIQKIVHPSAPPLDFNETKDVNEPPSQVDIPVASSVLVAPVAKVAPGLKEKEKAFDNTNNNLSQQQSDTDSHDDNDSLLVDKEMSDFDMQNFTEPSDDLTEVLNNQSSGLNGNVRLEVENASSQCFETFRKLDAENSDLKNKRNSESDGDVEIKKIKLESTVFSSTEETVCDKEEEDMLNSFVDVVYENVND